MDNPAKSPELAAKVDIALSARFYRALATVERERANVVPFPKSRTSLLFPCSEDARRDGPAPVRAAMPPVQPGRTAGPSHPIHAKPARLTSRPVIIAADDYQPLDPAKLAAIEWARRHRDGWDALGVAVAVAGAVMMLARCLPAIFPSWFN